MGGSMKVLSVGKSRTAPILLSAARDGEEAIGYRLSEGEYRSIGAPRAGDILPEEIAAKVSAYDARHRARSAAARILAFSENNRAMLIRKLRARGFTAVLAEQVADEMCERGYIREGDQLERAVLAAVKKLWGPRRIADALAAKGFAREEVLSCIDRLRAAGEIDFAESRRILIEKKLSAKASYTERRALLYRYGHTAADED